MTETNVFHHSQPGTFTDPLTEVLRNGARALLAQASGRDCGYEDESPGCLRAKARNKPCGFDWDYIMREIDRKFDRSPGLQVLR